MAHVRFGQRQEWGEEEKKPFLRKLLARSWFIFIPLLGVWWFHMRDLTPQVKAIEAEIHEEQISAEQTRSETLGRARKLGIDISRLKAFGDTIVVRREQIESLLDSVRVLQKAHIEETKMLEAQTDSLRQILSEAEGRSMEYSALLQEMQVQVDSLRTLIAAHREESATLKEETSQARDLMDRVLHPEEYRKNNALVAGEGEFPDRDALKKR